MPVSRAANSDSFTVTTPSDHEIRMTRLFNAPRQLVFEAMTKPEHVAQWWGRLGDGYSVPVCEIDLRVGGRYRFSIAGRPATFRAQIASLTNHYSPALFGEGFFFNVPRRLIVSLTSDW